MLLHIEWNSFKWKDMQRKDNNKMFFKFFINCAIYLGPGYIQVPNINQL